MAVLPSNSTESPHQHFAKRGTDSPVAEVAFPPNRPWERVVRPELVEAIEDLFPMDERLVPDPTYKDLAFNITASLILAVNRGVEDLRIPFGWRTIAGCMGLPATENVRKGTLRDEMGTGKILMRYWNRVLPEATIYRHDFRRGLSREFGDVEQALGEEVLDVRDASTQDLPFEIESPVRLAKGAPSGKASAVRRLCEKRDTIVKEEANPENAPTRGTEQVLHYMNALPEWTNLFSRGSIPKKRFEEAKKQIESWPDDSPQARARRQQAFTKLSTIWACPAPRYVHTGLTGTARIFAIEPSLAGINKELRRILLQDWIELDLRQAHLAIVSVNWDIPGLEAFLDSDQDFWRDVYEHTGAESAGYRFEPIKAAIKATTYTIVFGGGATMQLRSFVNAYHDARSDDDLRVVDTWLLERMREHPLVARVLDARKRRLRETRDRDTMTDVFGRKLYRVHYRSRGWVELYPGTYQEVNFPGNLGLLSRIVQSRELHLLLPALELAEHQLSLENPRHWIGLWQHDGFSIKVREKKPVRAKKCVQDYKETVDEHTGPYPTELEVKYAPEWANLDEA